MIRRPAVLQGFLSLFEKPHYLEVGVSRGATFWKIEAHRKVAVDPAFKFDLKEAQASLPNAIFHAVTSDVFFGEIASRDDPYDVIFLDGLHTAEQTLRDLLNAIQFLKPSGVIVVDDVVPSSYAASMPDRVKARRLREALAVEDRAWMGDVYRVVFFVAAFLQQFQFHTASDTRGQLVLWRGQRAASALAPRTIEAVGRMAYEQVIFDRDVFRFKTFAEILEEVRASLARQPSP